MLHACNLLNNGRKTARSDPSSSAYCCNSVCIAQCLAFFEAPQRTRMKTMSCRIFPVSALRLSKDAFSATIHFSLPSVVDNALTQCDINYVLLTAPLVSLTTATKETRGHDSQIHWRGVGAYAADNSFGRPVVVVVRMKSCCQVLSYIKQCISP